MAFVQKNAAAFWPPAGIALAALLLGGYRYVPGIALGALLGTLSSGASLLTAAGVMVGNTFAACLAAGLLKRSGFTSGIQRLRDVLALVIFGAMLAPMVSATLGVAAIGLAGWDPGISPGSVWRTWWLGDAMGVLIVAPLALAWSAPPAEPWNTNRKAQGLLTLVLIVLVAQLVFSGYFSSLTTDYLLAYTVFPLVIWTALRFRQRGVSLGTLAFSAIAIWNTVHGAGPFVRATQDESLMLLQGFLGLVAITALSLAAAMGERLRAEQKLRKIQVTLEQRVRERTVELAEINQTLVAEIEERRKIEEKLRYLSTHDSLTGLYNRNFFIEELDRLERSAVYPVSLVFIDLDGLKAVNDRDGHMAGDAILQQAAGLLLQTFRGGDVVARIGGDEFCVLLPNTNAPMAEEITARVEDNLRTFNQAHPEASLSFSMGVAVAEEPTHLAGIFKLADERMYANKFSRR